MNREILFRAKAINRDERYETRTRYKNGDWVYGLVSRLGSEKYDIPMEMTNTDGTSGIDVDRKTIGQYTGLTDKNGTKIFEGDVLEGDLNDDLDPGAKWRSEVVWGKFGWMCKERQILPMDELDIREGEIIGNIYDNPELMEATK